MEYIEYCYYSNPGSLKHDFMISYVRIGKLVTISAYSMNGKSYSKNQSISGGRMNLSLGDEIANDLGDGNVLGGNIMYFSSRVGGDQYPSSSGYIQNRVNCSVNYREITIDDVEKNDKVYNFTVSFSCV